MDSFQNNNTIMDPSHCPRGCGFFGLEANHGLCSKCYIKEKMAIISEPRRDPVISHLISNVDKLVDAIISLNQRFEKNCEPVPVLKNRCRSCNKNVGLLGFLCRCGQIFCGSHRYPEEHPCEFDYKTNGKIAIEKENPVCKADKLKDMV